MQYDRRTILHLVALGRITPAEAERLIIAWNAGREGFWVFAGCIAIALLAQTNLAEGLPALMHVAHSLRASEWLHCAVSTITQFYGGVR